MKKCFFTGLALLLPLALTIMITVFMVNFLTTPFIGIVKPALEHFEIFKKGFLFLSGPQVLQYGSRALILLLLFLVTVLVGALTRWMVVHYFLRLGDYILHRIPFINSIYKTSQDVIKTIFVNNRKAFKQVALVPFPDKDTLSIGLVTRENIPNIDGKAMIAVFVPTTPNPTSGFLMLFEKKDVTYLKMTIEEAFKFVISCGVIPSPFTPKTSMPVEASENIAEEPRG